MKNRPPTKNSPGSGEGAHCSLVDAWPRCIEERRRAEDLLKLHGRWSERRRGGRRAGAGDRAEGEEVAGASDFHGAVKIGPGYPLKGAPALDQGGTKYMAEGRIKWYSHQLGHGFIVCEDPVGDVFMRSEDIGGDDPWSFDVGVKVTFEVVDNPQGKEARNVFKVS